MAKYSEGEAIGVCNTIAKNIKKIRIGIYNGKSGICIYRNRKRF